jgi:predicted protein tyrosine phosphatase
LNKVDVHDGDEDENDDDDVEENEELIDMLHVVWMMEKSKHRFLKKNYKDKDRSFNYL